MTARQRQSIRASRPRAPAIARTAAPDVQAESQTASPNIQTISSPLPALSTMTGLQRGQGPTHRESAALLQLQRTHGNRFVQRLIDAPPAPAPAMPIAPKQPEIESRAPEAPTAAAPEIENAAPAAAAVSSATPAPPVTSPVPTTASSAIAAPAATTPPAAVPAIPSPTPMTATAPASPSATTAKTPIFQAIVPVIAPPTQSAVSTGVTNTASTAAPTSQATASPTAANATAEADTKTPEGEAAAPTATTNTATTPETAAPAGQNASSATATASATSAATEAASRGTAPAEADKASTETATEKTPEGEGAAPAGKAAVEQAPEPTPGPEANPGFQGVMGRLNKAAKKETRHAPAPALTSQARAAAVPPSNEREGQAQANQVDAMSQQQPGKPDPNSFLNMLRAELQRIAPQNLDDMDKFKEEGRAGQLKGAISGNVTQQTQAAASGIRGATEQQPDPQSVPEQEATPMPEAETPPPAPNLNAQEALPAAKPDSQVSAEQNTKQADQLMAENNIDEEQLKDANEPQFNQALESRQQLQEHAEKLPETYRAEEQNQLNAAGTQMAADERQAVTGMRAERNKAQSKVGAKQQAVKSDEEKARERLSSQINTKYEETRKKVQSKLDSIDTETNQMFDTGEQAVRQRFENYVATEMDKYKDERYSGALGKGRWIKDKFVGLPSEADQIYERGKKQYLDEMDAVLVRIADTVEKRLKEAKDEIANGRREISEIVAAAPRELQTYAREAEQNISGKFDELQQGVDSKKQELAQKLARRYQDASQKLDDRIKELQAENKGLLDGFIGKILEIIKLLKDFKDRIGSLIGQAGDVILKIVKHPVRFLGNLLSAVKLGFNQFAGNILKHLKTGLMGWLFGALSGAGLQLPETFDFKGIVSIVLQVLGLTVDRLRAKVGKIIGQRNLMLIEKAWEYVSVLVKEGPAGLWKHIKDQLSNLKETIIDGIRDWVITQVVQQAVIWIVSLFNPASALFKAIQAIYGVVMFFVERIEQILQLVEAVIQSVSKIVEGNIADAANWVENAMGRTVPVIISFLARLLGLGGISEKIKNIIEKIQDKVDKTIDKVIAKIISKVKSLFGKGKKGGKAEEGAADEKLPEQTFAATSETHKVWIGTQQGHYRAMMSSQTTPIREFLNQAKKNDHISDDGKAQIPAARKILKDIDRTLGIIEKQKRKGKSIKPLLKALLTLEHDLGIVLAQIMGEVPIAKFDERYKLEGYVSTYENMPKQRKDKMTPDHQPQAALLKHIADKQVFSGRKIQIVARGHAVGGWAINLHANRHYAGRTYGKSGADGKSKINSAIASAADPDAKRSAAIKVLKSELDKDVTAMKKAITAKSSSDVWKDIAKSKKLSKQQKENLIKTVRGQIDAGEDRIAAHDLDSLKDRI